MLPNLGQLSLMRTGGTLARGQSPEDVICVICFHSLAAPPPDGANVWPFDDDPVIWIVACNNEHAFHKGCLRAYARDSESPSRCPECRVPMLPQVLTHVSRPSSGEHAAREAREAEERAEGQERDAEDARRREREMLERMQQEFQEMDAEERRMHADAYGDSDEEEGRDSDSDQEEDRHRYDMTVEFLDSEEEAEAEEWLGDSGEEEEPEMVARRSNLETEQANWSARADLERVAELASREPGAGVAARLQSIKDVEAAVLTCIARGNPAMFGTPTYRGNMIRRLTQPGANQLRTLIVSDPDVGHTNVSWFAIKGQLLRLLAAYADDARVQVALRGMNAQQQGRASWDSEGAFEEAIRQYVFHLVSLPREDPAVLGPVSEFARNSKDSRLIDANRVLHHLKWDTLVRDEWLLLYNGRHPDLDEYGVLDAGSGNRLIPDTEERVEFLLDTLGVEATDEAVSAATEPDVYGEVLESLGAVLANFKVWHERYSGFDEYEALSNDDATIPFPFGKEVIQLWGLANYMHGVPEQLEFNTRPRFLGGRGSVAPFMTLEEPERAQRYELMRERLTRLVWLGVTWWVGRPYPANNDSATPDEMQHFFWAYVAPEYKTEDGTDHLIFQYEDLTDLAMVINRNGMMRDQWAGDRRTGPWFRNLGEFRAGPWFRNLGMDNATTPPGTPPRARDGGETPNPRRQRRD